MRDMADVFKVAPGKFVMLHPNTFTADKQRHPNAGQIGKVVSTAPDKTLVEMEQDGDKGTFLILPERMWIVLPEFYCETVSKNPTHHAYQLSQTGIDCIQTGGHDWMITDNGRGAFA